ncbi:MAG TPA: FAD-dependent oxidoreductase [Alphaproteobacteria bacterium]|nr:FAD-dependent oxidoreductase [Alphaproteobacteria bacterium]
MSSIFADGFKDTPYWWEAAHPITGDDAFPTESPTQIPAENNVIIIGSGFAGLSAAMELGRQGVAVTVIDAKIIGIGASSRAAGFISGRAGVSKQINLEKMVGESHATAILEEADEAYQHFQRIIAREEIDCDFNGNGRFVGAYTPQSYEAIARKAEEYNRDGQNRFFMVSRQDQDTYVKSDYFHGGMVTRDAGSLHPAKYHAGLVKTCLRYGVKLIGNTRATKINKTHAGFTVTTNRGNIKADQVLLATGGYTDRVSPWHRKRIIPMSSTIIATEPIGKARVDAMLPFGCAVIDTRRVIRFARPSPDGTRLLFGGRARFTPIDAKKSVRILHGYMREMFPDMADVSITHSWAGFMAFTFDFLPKIGRHDDIHYAMACNGGAGVVMMSWLGFQAARNIMQTTNQPSAFEGLPFKTMPLYSGIPWFVPVIGTWYRFRDWYDLRRSA